MTNEYSHSIENRNKMKSIRMLEIVLSDNQIQRMEKNAEVRTMKHNSNKRRLTFTVCSSLTY
ncbi:UNVERIFIED_CONTAM: hypothetical protein NCL1_12325 [Trichonephila clavipes]